MLTNFALFDLGVPELLIILAIILLLFGGKKLPELSKSLGESMKELRKGINDGNDPKKDQPSVTPPTPTASTTTPPVNDTAKKPPLV